MMRGFLTLFSFAAALLFPWPVAALVSIISALFVPLVPLAVGMFADALYWAPGAANLPHATLLGGAVTALAYLVRDRLAPGIIDG